MRKLGLHMARWIPLTLLMLIGGPAMAQDLHFSQFYAHPLHMNPALTGQFEGTYRFAGIARRQWSSVTAQPFQSFGGSVDMNGVFNVKFLHAGIKFSHDYAGLSNVTQSQIDLPFALSFKMGNAKTHHISLGGQVGFAQVSLDQSRLHFGDQFIDGRFDPLQPTSDQLFARPFTYADYSAGIFYQWKRSERERIGLGISQFHLNEPNTSFGGTHEASMKMRSNVHMISSIPLGSTPYDLMPAGQFMMQGTQREILFGTSFRMHFDESTLHRENLRFGLWTRWGDAVIGSVGYQKKNLYMGASYDVNYSSLRIASRYRGAWELSLVYTISTVREKTKRIRLCPSFI